MNLIEVLKEVFGTEDTASSPPQRGSKEKAPEVNPEADPLVETIKEVFTTQESQ